MRQEPIARVFGPAGGLSSQLPGYQYRPQQEEAARAIWQAFEDRRACVVEAGTGVGKSLAYLVPAIERATESPVVISTHTISLQQQLVAKDIPLALKLFPDRHVTVELVKGRSNYLCLNNLEIARTDIFHISEPVFRQVQAWAATTETGDVADMPVAYNAWPELGASVETCRARECPFYERCHLFAMRRRAAEARLVVTNHALYFADLMVRAAADRSILPPHEAVVFDEAHHLEDVATKAFGAEVASWRVPALIDRVRRLKDGDIEGPRLTGLAAASDELFGAFDGAHFEFGLDDESTAPALERAGSVGVELQTGLRSLAADLTAAAKLRQGVEKDRYEGLATQAQAACDAFATVLGEPPAGHIRWGSRDSGDRNGRRGKHRTTLTSTPISVAEALRGLFWDGRGTVVMTSATLSNSGGFTFLRSRIAVPDDAIESVIGSPFDFPRQALLYVPVAMPPPPTPTNGTRDAYLSTAADEIVRLVELTGGRAFLLFTSRQVLSDMHERISGRLPFPIFRQGDAQPARLLEQFRLSGNGVLMGNQTFWEGVDVQGEALSLVVIDRIPFAVPDSPVTRARTEAIRQRGGHGFYDFSLPQAQIKLKQGFGRLIRTSSDRGIVCVLDSRLATAHYRQDFLAHLPPATRASIWPRVVRFWTGAAVGSP